MGSPNSKHTPTPPSEDQTWKCGEFRNYNKLFPSNGPSPRNVRQCSVENCNTKWLFVDQEKKWVVSSQSHWYEPYGQF
ncbi:hypothetical protein OCU04_012091 [Sclerotinia nivalis]|uniref:Uncharacterized protein n=1 Tax=Sclerotinia nivalis TaxID=352851 RepID=A0A9X0AA80_9HELO|nr:hypothetical protein OCU04_012091 [Sclerotinia nivalis]